MAKQARIQGLIVGHRRQQQDFVRALEQTGIRPVISDSYGTLSELPAAFKHLQSAGHFGKITVEW
jgi:D-arabinose 1-dehydrogenase-like Zn-dependent alcohol dehydrogenase